jgi:hypothetical protein
MLSASSADDGITWSPGSERIRPGIDRFARNLPIAANAVPLTPRSPKQSLMIAASTVACIGALYVHHMPLRYDSASGRARDSSTRNSLVALSPARIVPMPA